MELPQPPTPAAEGPAAAAAIAEAVRGGVARVLEAAATDGLLAAASLRYLPDPPPVHLHPAHVHDRPDQIVLAAAAAGGGGTGGDWQLASSLGASMAGGGGSLATQLLASPAHAAVPPGPAATAAHLLPAPHLEHPMEDWTMYDTVVSVRHVGRSGQSLHTSIASVLSLPECAGTLAHPTGAVPVLASNPFTGPRLQSSTCSQRNTFRISLQVWLGSLGCSLARWSPGLLALAVDGPLLCVLTEGELRDCCGVAPDRARAAILEALARCAMVLLGPGAKLWPPPCLVPNSGIQWHTALRRAQAHASQLWWLLPLQCPQPMPVFVSSRSLPLVWLYSAVSLGSNIADLPNPHHPTPTLPQRAAAQQHAPAHAAAAARPRQPRHAAVPGGCGGAPGAAHSAAGRHLCLLRPGMS